MRPIVKCDLCDWRDTVAVIWHLRAWYRAPCPKCGKGEILDAGEVRMVDELLRLQAEGLVRVHDDATPLKGREVVVKLNTAAEPPVSILEQGIEP